MIKQIRWPSFSNKIYALLFLVHSFISCTGQVKTNLPKDSVSNVQKITDQGLGLPKTKEEMKSFLASGVDPYFIETKDTYSLRGPQCIVRNLIQDKKGDFWLATWQGIIKYDGKVFTNYTLKEGLIHFHVITLFEDSKGNIWFSNARGGIYRYDGKSFKLFTTNDGLPDNTSNCITEDKSGDIWLGTENGVCRYNGKSFTNYSRKDGICDDFINAILNDKSGKIWIASNNGITIYDGKSFKKFKEKDNLQFKQVVSLFQDRMGNIWIGSGAKQAGGFGLCRYDGRSVIPSVSAYFVMYICQDKNGNLWFAHNKGADNVNFALYRYDGKSFFKVIEQNKAGNPVIFGILEDNKGNIWFGTAKGLCKYNGNSFNYFTD